MRTLSLRSLPKRNFWKTSKFETPLRKRVLDFLLRDLVPSLIILIVLSLCAVFVGAKIDRAKQAHTPHVVHVEILR